MLHRSRKVALSALAVGVLGAASLGLSPAMAQTSAASPPLVVVPGPAGTFQQNFNPFSKALVGTMGLIYQ
ncbi:MAG: hypothetical protein ACYCOU_22360, partial [Sulfobacillus sp.]